MGKKAKNKGHWKSGGSIQQLPKNELSNVFAWSQPKHTVLAGWRRPACYVHNYDARMVCRQCGLTRARTQERESQPTNSPPSKRVLTHPHLIIPPAVVAVSAKERIAELDLIITNMTGRAGCASVCAKRNSSRKRNHRSDPSSEKWKKPGRIWGARKGSWI